MATKRPLAEGVFGAKLIQFFIDNGYEAIPTDAECISDPFSESSDQMQYRITFDDETVADCLVTFESKISLDITSIEEYNRVI